jgi:hypothetical protein
MTAVTIARESSFGSGEQGRYASEFFTTVKPSHTQA